MNRTHSFVEYTLANNASLSHCNQSWQHLVDKTATWSQKGYLKKKKKLILELSCLQANVVTKSWNKETKTISYKRQILISASNP
jgi:hypothetical protein